MVVGLPPFSEGIEAVAKPLGTTIGAVSVVITTYQAFNDPKGFQLHHAIDIVAGIGSILFPGFGLLWFVGDMISRGINGKGIAENIQEAIEQ